MPPSDKVHIYLKSKQKIICHVFSEYITNMLQLKNTSVPPETQSFAHPVKSYSKCTCKLL